MINSKVLHRLSSIGDAIIPNFLFLPTFIAPDPSLIYTKFVQPVISSSLNYIIFSEDIFWQKEILDNMQLICNYQQSGKSNELEISILIQRIWISLYENTDYSIPEDKSAAKTKARLQLMMQYIQSNYAKGITLDDIACSASISKSSALHLFQDILGMTPVSYLSNYRLSQAALQIKNTEAKIETIAIDNGFSSCEYFCKCFKRAYGQTPTEYRHNILVLKNPPSHH